MNFNLLLSVRAVHRWRMDERYFCLGLFRLLAFRLFDGFGVIQRIFGHPVPVASESVKVHFMSRQIVEGNPVSGNGFTVSITVLKTVEEFDKFVEMILKRSCFGKIHKDSQCPVFSSIG